MMNRAEAIQEKFPNEKSKEFIFWNISLNSFCFSN